MRKELPLLRTQEQVTGQEEGTRRLLLWPALASRGSREPSSCCGEVRTRSKLLAQVTVMSSRALLLILGVLLLLLSLAQGGIRLQKKIFRGR